MKKILDTYHIAGDNISPLTVESNNPITYSQWHRLIIDRRGHYVTMIVRSERGPGETEDDVRKDEVLPRYVRLYAAN